MARVNQRVLDFEEGILNSVQLIDEADGSRLGLLNTIDEVRENLVMAYGDDFQDDYNELLGIETDDDEVREEETDDNT